MEEKQLRLMRAFETFDLWEEEWSHHSSKKPLRMEAYRNKKGDYLDARHGSRRPGLIKMIARLGIAPIKRHRSHSVCSMGRGKNGRWYGWSHRAMCSFGKGDRIFEEQYGNDHTPSRKHGRKPIKTDRDARTAASRFAESVS